MSKWLNFHVYYSDIDRLVLECIDPLMQRIEADCERCFWERHFAGGRNVMLRVLPKSRKKKKLREEILGVVKEFLDASPSKDQQDYDPEMIRILLLSESEEPEQYDLSYRNNVVMEAPYDREKSKFASEDAILLQEYFYSDVSPLVVSILGSGADRMTEVLKLYFLHALMLKGNYPEGCISFKSHWEGFLKGCKKHEMNSFLQNIDTFFQQKREEIFSLMLFVKDCYDRKDFSSDPTLNYWYSIESKYLALAEDWLKDGKKICISWNEEDIERNAELVPEYSEYSDFLATMYQNREFMLSMINDIPFNRNRILTNLLYLVVNAVGLPALKKFLLCFLSHKAVEDYYDCDSMVILNEIINDMTKSYNSMNDQTGSTA